MRVHTIDLHFQGLPHAIAAYLIFGPAGPVLLETGPGSTLPALQAGLAEHGVEPSDIHHVLLTHIHLDHAGAAGWWARRGAHIYVHHLGAPHLIDPSRLLASAERIYGAQMEPLWGEFLPVPAESLTPLSDGDVVQAGGLAFTALDTPGHAKHHLVYAVEGVAFTGDTAAIRLPGCQFISLPTPPPEFDLDVWRATVARLAGHSFSTIYPIHFGPIDDPAAHWAALDRLLFESAQFVRTRLQAGMERSEIIAEYGAWNLRRAEQAGGSGPTLEQYASTNRAAMSVDGLIRYWGKRGHD